MRPSSLDDRRRSSTVGGGSFLGVLFVVFLVLKLTPPVSEWSWWWVTAPLWLPIAAALVLAIAAALVLAIAKTVQS